jgi:hypothetical protein
MFYSRFALLVLLLASLALAAEPFSTEATPAAPAAAVVAQVNIFIAILVPLMMFMVVLAAVVYAGGSIFGVETRARATVWAQGMLAAVGISAVILALLYFILPGIMSGQANVTDIEKQIIEPLVRIAQVSLLGLIVLFVVLAAAVYAGGQIFGAETRARASGWSTALLSGAILAAVVYVVVFQIVTQLGNTFFAGTGLALYAQLIVDIVFFVAFFILITYLLSKVFKIPEWEAYLNIEMSNLMASFLLVVFILGLFAAGTAIAGVYTAGACGTMQSCTPSQAAISYMRDTVQYSVFRGMMDVYKIQACTSVLSTFSRRIGEYVLTQTFKVFPGLDTFVSITNVLSIGLISVYGSLSAQITLLYLVDATMEKFILPAGLILRFFPPTRDAGAFLISLAFGFALIFPTTYLINKQIFAEIGGQPYPSQAAIVDYLCGGSYVFYGLLISHDNFLFSSIPGVGLFLEHLFSESTIQATYMSSFLPLMQNIAALSLLALFMPALSMVVTIAFINAMTKFIVSKV